ncbi:MAG: flagellar basal body L-ring protein FlgH [Syntrophales bacterium]|nr:flagellar basal body L-ring protein FlgH [Syntrophales bacterium]
MLLLIIRGVLIFIVSMLFICGCAERYSVKPEHYNAFPEAKHAPSVQPAQGSLWVGENNRNMLFTDNKARYVNDTITIVIEESSLGQNRATTNTSRTTTTGTSISALLGIDTSILKRNPNMGSSISVGGESTNSLKGSGDTSRGSTLKAVVTGRVVKVLENGNLLIEGRKQITINAEDQYLIITGIVRPQDVTAENYVYSTSISDARIVFTGSGVINDKMRPGWGTRILDWIWPF